MSTPSSRPTPQPPRPRPWGAPARPALLPLVVLGLLPACAAAPKRDRGAPTGGLGGGLDAPGDSGGPAAQDTTRGARRIKLTAGSLLDTALDVPARRCRWLGWGSRPSAPGCCLSRGFPMPMSCTGYRSGP